MKSEDELRQALQRYQDERWALRDHYEREIARINARIGYLSATLAREERKRKSEAHRKPPAEESNEPPPAPIWRTYRSLDGNLTYLWGNTSWVWITVYAPGDEQPLLIAEGPGALIVADMERSGDVLEANRDNEQRQEEGPPG